MRQSTKRLLSGLLSIVFLFFGFFIFIYLIRPLYGEIQQLRSDVLIKQNDLNNQKSLTDQFKKIVNDYQDKQKIQETLLLILPNNPEIGEALTQINGLAEANNLEISSLNVSKLGSLASLNLPPKNSFSTLNLKPLGSFDINLRMNGNYQNFKNFLNQIETNIRFFNFKNISISLNTASSLAEANKTNKQSNLIFEVVLSSYYQGE